VQAEPHERTVPRALHAPDPPSLARIAFVLVGTSHPGNVGATARAMHAMGLGDLRLVAPRFPDVAARDEARAFASGAVEVLERARVHDSLSSALGDTVLAVAVSAEPREFGPPPSTPEDAAADALDVLAADPAHRVAFVFGAERTGLSIASVQACGRLVGIPASPGRASLNLAQAVQVLAYCVRRSALAHEAVAPPADDERLASARAVEGLLAHMERALVAIGFLDPSHPKKLLPRLRRMVLRSRPRIEEVDLLRGAFRRIERLARRIGR
jgi:tRNA/rRNA methyltransferase